jgi:hypothetical protein
MSRKHLLLLIALSVVIIGAAVFTIANHHDDSGPTFIPANEGLIGTASFDVADTEHSGTWTRGTVFAIDRGDKIQLRIIGEMEMGKDDPTGVLVDTALDEEYAHPSFVLSNAYCNWDQKDGLPRLSTNIYQIRIGYSAFAEERAIGGGSFVADFESTDRFDRSEGKIDLIVGAGSYFENGILFKYPATEIVTIYFD